jgi:Zn-dependent peptidase ImmA (M78 family)
MNLYEKIMEELSDELIIDDTAILPTDIKGFYMNSKNSNVILLNKNIDTITEMACTLVEEIGHHYTTVGDITDQSVIENRKQELKARRWAVNKFIRLENLIEAFNAGVTSKYELAEYLEVTEEFLVMALEHFKSIYGIHCSIGDYIIYFEPLGILKKL